METDLAQFHWDPSRYLALMREEVPDYEQLQAAAVEASGALEVRTILELGTGTGETAKRVLEAHPHAHLHGIDASEPMLEVARSSLGGRDVRLELGRIEDALPAGPFDLVLSALAVHHLTAAEKAKLFDRVARALRHGGRFVLADVVVPDDPDDAVTPIDGSYDRPDTAPDQLQWLRAAGLRPELSWSRRDLAVIVADKP